MNVNNQDAKRIECSISIIAPDYQMEIQKQLERIGISQSRIIVPKCVRSVVYEIAQVKSSTWCLEDALTEMFFSIQNSFGSLIKLIRENNYKVEIDICVVHKGKYPELFIGNRLIKKINELNADISIDII